MLGGSDLSAKSSGNDFCLYAALPNYPQPGRWRTVVLMSHDPVPPKHNGLDEFRAAMAQRLVRFSVDAALPANVFTRAGMTQFVRLLLKKSLAPTP